MSLHGCKVQGLLTLHTGRVIIIAVPVTASLEDLTYVVDAGDLMNEKRVLVVVSRTSDSTV